MSANERVPLSPRLARLYVQLTELLSVIEDAEEEETGRRPQLVAGPREPRLWLVTEDVEPDGRIHWQQQHMVAAFDPKEAARIAMARDEYWDTDEAARPKQMAVVAFNYPPEFPRYLDYVSGDRKYEAEAFEGMWDYTAAVIIEVADLLQIAEQEACSCGSAAPSHRHRGHPCCGGSMCCPGANR